MRPMSNKRPELLVLEKIGLSVKARGSDGEMMLLKNDQMTKFSEMAPHVLRYTFLFYFHFLHQKVSVMQKYFTY